MTKTTNTELPQAQLLLTTFTVHVYREMRLRFDDIEAESPEQAAELARERHFDEAADWSDCEGESLAALVDVHGDEEYAQSRVIDFEPGRLLKTAPKLLSAAEAVIASWEHGDLAAAVRELAEAVAQAKGLAA